jgi:hypothetical protein
MDTTCLYYTGHLPPEKFLLSIRNKLRESAGEIPIVSVSHYPIDLGKNHVVGEKPKTVWTAYQQIIIGLRLVETKWVVLCEDDTIYPPEHLRFVPLKDNLFWYNTNRWVCDPTEFWFANRANMSQLICARDLLLEFMEKRFDIIKGPEDPLMSFCSEPGRYKGKHDRHLGLATKCVRKYLTDIPLIGFNNRESLGGRRKISSNAVIKKELPYWGVAKELWRNTHG